MDEIEAAKDGD
jgi:hypothetical protein